MADVLITEELFRKVGSSNTGLMDKAESEGFANVQADEESDEKEQTTPNLVNDEDKQEEKNEEKKTNQNREHQDIEVEEQAGAQKDLKDSLLTWIEARLTGELNAVPALTQCSSQWNHEPSFINLETTNKRLVLIIVGLPGFGRSYVAAKASRYLRWAGHSCQVFGEQSQAQETINAFCLSEQEADSKLQAALAQLIASLHQGAAAAVFNSSNLTASTRDFVANYLACHSGRFDIELMFIEIVNNDEALCENYIQSISSTFQRQSVATLVGDCGQRLAQLQESYEPLHLSSRSSSLRCCGVVQLKNAILRNSHEPVVVSTNLAGYLPTRIAHYVTTLHYNTHPIYFTRHGQSIFNISDRVGGDSDLSADGEDYARRLGQFVSQDREVCDVVRMGESVQLWSSCLNRTQQTAQGIIDTGLFVRHTKWRELNELQSGLCDGYTYKEIESLFPHDHTARAKCKLTYKYPQGESYIDVCRRLEPIIYELESCNRPIIVVAHQAVLRCLYAFFDDHPVSEIPFIDIPLHTIFKLRVRCQHLSREEKEQKFCLLPEKVQKTHVARVARSPSLYS